ncbi:DUF4160 domain-containing protein [Roseateles chitosanitabidus]|uniref:DUF4160 domain-containing protein n=1 Tax=Roseateles chitosanitabidus TaxID=65048 RepID=UPI000A06CB44
MRDSRTVTVPPEGACRSATIAPESMPTLARLPKSRLVMHRRDHPPPHLHIYANDGDEAIMDIRTLHLIGGAVRPATLQEARVWASQNQALLMSTWRAMHQ